MSRLIDVEYSGNRVLKTYAHLGEDGRKKITTETVEDIRPILKSLKDVAQNPKKSDFRLKASIPFTLLDDESKKCSKIWGCTMKDAFAEIVSCNTDRGRRVIKKLTEDLDFKALQARNY